MKFYIYLNTEEITEHIRCVVKTKLKFYHRHVTITEGLKSGAMQQKMTVPSQNGDPDWLITKPAWWCHFSEAADNVGCMIFK